MVNRISTGVTALDEKLGGGFSEKSNILVIGPPGKEKNKLALYFLLNGLKNREHTSYVTTDYAPEEILTEMQEHHQSNNSDETVQKLNIIDCYSWSLEQKVNLPNVYYISSISALNQLSIGINEVQNKVPSVGSHQRLVVNSLSTLLMHNPSDVILKFIEIQNNRHKATNTTSLLLLEQGMHDEKVVTTLEHLCDGLLEIQHKENKTQIRAPMMKQAEEFEWTSINLV